MYTIFKNDTSIILTDDVKKLRHKNLIYWNQVDHQNVLLDDFIESKKEVVIYHDDISILWREFAQRFIVIEAAGGLVRNAVMKYCLFIGLTSGICQKAKLKQEKAKKWLL